MSTYGKLVAETTDQYLAALDAAQQNFLKSFAAFAAAVPASPLATQAAVPGVPTVQEVTEANFSFAQKLLNQQQGFMQKLIANVPGDSPAVSAVAFGKTVSGKSKAAN